MPDAVLAWLASLAESVEPSVALWALNHVPFDGTHTLVPFLVGLVMLGVFVESGFTPAALAYLAEIADTTEEPSSSRTNWLANAGNTALNAGSWASVLATAAWYACRLAAVGRNR